MPQRLQKTVVPLTKGIDQSFDLHATPTDRLADVLNGRFNKAGAIETRPGFTRITNNLVEAAEVEDLGTAGACRLIFSTGRELCVAGHERLYGYNETEDDWFDRGAVSPCTTRIAPCFNGEENYYSGDMGNYGEYMLYACATVTELTTSAGGTTYIYRLKCFGRTKDGVTTFPMTELVETTLTSGRPHSVRVLGVEKTGHIIIVAALGGDGSDNRSTLRLWKYDTADPSTPPIVEVSSLKTNVLFEIDGTNEGSALRTYDIINILPEDVTAISSSTRAFVLVWCDWGGGGVTAGALMAELFTDTYTSLGTTDLNPGVDYYRCAACHANDGGAFYVTGWAALGDSAQDVLDELHAFAMQKLGFSVIWGPSIVDVLGSGYEEGNGAGPMNLGCCVGNDRSDQYRLVIVWDKVGAALGSGTTNYSGVSAVAQFEWNLYRRSVKPSNGDVDGGKKTVFNLIPASHPWNYNNRFYVAAVSYANYPFQFGYSTILHLDEDADNEQATTNRPRMVSLYDMGVSLSFSPEAMRRGSLQSAVNTDPGVFRFLHGWASQAVNKSSNSPSGYRAAHDELTVDFTAPIGSTVAIEDAAVIGGAMWTWYPGLTTKTCELGFPCPPIVVDFDEVDDASPPSSFVDAGTWLAAAVWQYFDGGGFLHRSAPSANPILVMDEEYIKYDARSYPASLRDPETTNCVWYRTDANGVFVRVMYPHQIAANTDAGATAQDFYQLDEVVGLEPLYINNFELEAVAPEGGLFATKAAGRVWLGGFTRRNRVQFSKPLTPGTATEPALAPEFNEAFGRLIPDGSENTGIAALEDNIVIFTSDGVYLCGGEGPDDGGGGDSFPRSLSLVERVGCIEFRSVCEYAGGVMFQGRRGIYDLTRNQSVRFIGFPVVDLTDAYPTITSSVLDETHSEVRFTCVNAASDDSIVLVYNYAFELWSVWRPMRYTDTPIVAVSACMHRDVYHLLEADGTVWKQDGSSFKDNGTVFVPPALETPWLQFAGQGGWKRMRQLIPMLAEHDPFKLKVTVWADFEDEPCQTEVLTAAQIAQFANRGGACQPLISFVRQRCEAIKLRIEGLEDERTGTGQGYTISGLTLGWVPKSGLYRAPNKQRV